jgi:hypothetical protein
LHNQKDVVSLNSDNSNEVFILTLLIMKLSDNMPTTEQGLITDALAFTKYSNDVEAMEYLNDVLIELSYIMKAGTFQVFKEKINTMLNA